MPIISSLSADSARGYGFTSGRLFTPAIISGLKFWYDASDTGTITVSGSKATAITNKAGVAFTLANPTSGDQPTIVSNGRNGKQILRLATNSTLYNISATPMDGATNITIFFAGKTNSTTNGYKFSFGTNNGIGGFPLIYQLNNKNYFETGSGTNSITGSSSFNGVANIQYVEAKGSGGTTQKTITGTTETNTAAGTNFTVGGGSTWLTSLGVGAGGATDFDFYEICVYNRALTAGEYTSVVDYLKAKWAI